MKLLTSAVIKKLEKFPLRSQDGKGDNAQIIVKFFMPEGDATWYVLEGEKRTDGDWEFYGYVILNGEREYGYFMFSELQSLRSPQLRLPVERDMYFDNKTMKDVTK